MPRSSRALELGAWEIPGAGAGDGAQHPRDSRRRREPHLLRRPVRRILDLRHRLPRHPDRRSASAGDSADCTSSGIVQYIGPDRTADWVEFYSQIFGFTPLPDSNALRHHAQGAAARKPLPQVLPPADRARRHRPVRAGRGASAAHRLRHARRAGAPWSSCRSAASSSSSRRRFTRASAARSPSPRWAV